MSKVISDELRSVVFHREHMLKRPNQEQLPTLDDADEHKLPAMNKLLLQMHEFYREMRSSGIKLQNYWYNKYPAEDMYLLGDDGYKDWPRFVISVRSAWLNPKYGIALHGGFNFRLHLIQDGYEGRGEIADWINICIRHVNTTPISFVSWREHVKALGSFLRNRSDAYFYDIPMPFNTSVFSGLLEKGMNFRTSAFNLAVDDACTVMKKIITRKQHLFVLTKEKAGY